MLTRAARHDACIPYDSRSAEPVRRTRGGAHVAEGVAALRRMFGERFSAALDDPTAMMDAFERHNARVRASIPAGRLLEWTVTDGWEPICERLGVPVPSEPFPATNSTNETRAMLGLQPLA